MAAEGMLNAGPVATDIRVSIARPKDLSIQSDGLPVGLYRPDHLTQYPSRRVVYMTFCKNGTALLRVENHNYAGQTLSGIYLGGDNQVGEEHVDWFRQYMNPTWREEQVFQELKAQGITDKWNWASFEVMKTMPYKRAVAESRDARIRDDDYYVPTFEGSSQMSREEENSRRQVFLGSITEEMHTLFGRVLDLSLHRSDADSCKELATTMLRGMDRIQQRIDQEMNKWPVVNVKEERGRIIEDFASNWVNDKPWGPR